ncbi:MAG TPA: N-acetyltransferase [Myxococcaceae bacterium]|nr:N-acetyltransferase [Myxococcaceae bacterium]
MPVQTADPMKTRSGERPPKAPVELVQVTTGAELDAFVRFQLDLYRDDPRFVPPIVAERREFLRPEHNPFFAHATAAYFMARRDGAWVGRIAAVDDTAYNQFHNAQVGFFGMFESIDDPEVAGALLRRAGAWVSERGMRSMLGPVNLSTNHDCGLLVEGFDTPPSMMQPYNPPHYAALLEVAGLKRFRDLYMYALSTALPPPEPVVRAADRLREKAGVKVRPFDLRRLPEELQRIKAIQAEAALHERNWAFVPLNEEEVDFLAARLRHLATLSPGLCLFAEVNEEPVAFSLTLPDGNAAVKAAGGSLTTWGLPIGALKMAWAARRVDSVRVLLLGVADAWKRRGLESLLYLETLKVAREQGYAGGELGWVAEDNGPLNRALVSMGARRHKTYRIYEQRLG